jgi:hypothetical protein
MVRSIRQHTSAYVRPHTSAYASIRQIRVLTPEDDAALAGRVPTSRAASARSYVRIRQDTSAFVRIRQDTSGFVRIRQDSSGFVRIRQDTSGYVSIRKCCRYLLAQAPPQQLHADAPSTRRGRERCRFFTSAYVSIRQHTSVLPLHSSCMPMRRQRGAGESAAVFSL